MNKEWEQVKQFHVTFGHPAADKPQALESDRVKKRYAWMLEELNEFVEAGDDQVEQADALIDLIYFALGTLVEMGIQPDRLFEIVHHANMSKLWPDGVPHYSAEGKTIKPPSWEDPHQALQQIIETMAEENAR